MTDTAKLTLYDMTAGWRECLLEDPDGDHLQFTLNYSFGHAEVTVEASQEGEIAVVRMNRRQAAELVDWLQKTILVEEPK